MTPEARITVQRVLDKAARRLLAEMDSVSPAGSDTNTRNDRFDDGALLVKGERIPVSVGTDREVMGRQQG